MTPFVWSVAEAPHVAPDRQTAVEQMLAAAVTFGTFTLRSGATSSRYFDKYQVLCNPEMLRSVATDMASTLRTRVTGPAVLVAPAVGAVPLASALSLTTGWPMLIVRCDQKRSYGTERSIEGLPRAADGVDDQIWAGREAVLIEDVVTSGSAVLEALEAARSIGLRVSHALCVLDRDGGGREALASADVDLHSVISNAEFSDWQAPAAGSQQ